MMSLSVSVCLRRQLVLSRGRGIKPKRVYARGAPCVFLIVLAASLVAIVIAT